MLIISFTVIGGFAAPSAFAASEAAVLADLATFVTGTDSIVATEGSDRDGSADNDAVLLFLPTSAPTSIPAFLKAAADVSNAAPRSDAAGAPISRFLIKVPVFGFIVLPRSP